MANVAHEIGNPAHSIMLGTSLIGDAWDELAPLVDRELAARPGETAATEAREELAAVLADLRIAAERIKSAVARLRQHVREEQLPAPPAGLRRR